MRVKMMSKRSENELTYSRVKEVKENGNNLDIVYWGSGDRGVGDLLTTYNLENWDYEVIPEVVVRDREAGNIIEGFETIEEAEKAIAQYEEDDEKAGTFEPQFYEIAVWDELDGDYLTFSMSPIKRARLSKGLTQKDLALASGSSIRTIQDWENGRRIPRDVYVLRRIAKVLGCMIEDLI